MGEKTSRGKELEKEGGRERRREIERRKKRRKMGKDGKILGKGMVKQ